MLRTPEIKDYSIGQDVFFSGLDALDVGVFVINREGYLVRYNGTAARIFGLDPDNGWSEHHFSSIDSVMALGIADRIENILNSPERICRHNISCTNPKGLFHVLDICCSSLAGDGGEDLVLGIITDVGDRSHQLSQSVDRFQELQTLLTVATSLSTSAGLQDILEVILTGATASQGLGFNRAFLFLYNPPNNCLVGHLAVGPASAEEAGHIWRELESRNLSLVELLEVKKRQSAGSISSIDSLVKDMTIRLDQDSLIGRVCSEGTWVNLETAPQVDSVTASFLERLGSRNMALVPMINKGNLMGLLAADCVITGRPISNASVQLLQILANQASVAMERARLYEEQLTRASQLEEMNRLLGESQDHIIKIEKVSIIGELTAAIAHELRNPLAVIGGFANLMLKSDITDEQREYLNIIAGETTRTEAVLDHVMDFHEASKSDRELIDFSELVGRNLQLAKGRRRRPEVAMTQSLSPEKMTVYGNYDQLSHALYQFFRLVSEDLIPPGNAEVRTERRDNQAQMIIRLNVSGQDRVRTVKALQQIFSENKTSQRLTVLVAGETLRYHGGNFGINCQEDAPPSLFVQLPISEEG